MVISIKTNTSALVALQQLAANNKELDVIQDRVSTGLKIRSARDDATSFSVAQKQRADLDAYDAVGQSVQRGINVLDISLEAMKEISNLLIDMKAKAVLAANPTLTPASRAMIDADYQAYVSQITTIINSATFDGFNLISKDPVVPATDDMTILAEPTANPALSITVPAINVKAITSALLGNVSTLAGATAEMTVLETVSGALSSAMAVMGGNLKRLETHSGFVAKLQDALTIGIGNLVDADLTAESARLKSVQIQQQLSTQSLQIANSRPQTILTLFQT